MKRETFKNVWDAIEDDPGAAASLKARSALMIAVRKFVHGSGLSQTQAARSLGVSQPRLSDLMRGRIDKFSLDALVDMLGATGSEVSIRVRRKAA
jgi:predicted XRE-type DNA-binding protein